MERLCHIYSILHLNNFGIALRAVISTLWKGLQALAAAFEKAVHRITVYRRPSRLSKRRCQSISVGDKHQPTLGEMQRAFHQTSQSGFLRMSPVLSFR